MLAVIRGLENWNHLLESAKFKFEVQIDHKNLEYFMKVQKLNRRQARWALYFSRLNFILKYVPGTKMGKVDRLSRRLDWKVEVENDNNNQVKIKIARSKDKEVVRVVEEIKRTEVKMLQGEEQQIEGNLVLKERTVYVLKNKALRVEIIWLYHDILVVGYKKKWKMVELVIRNY